MALVTSCIVLEITSRRGWVDCDLCVIRDAGFI
jgi:hypothetical protein